MGRVQINVIFANRDCNVVNGSLSLVSANRPTIHSAQSFQRDNHDEDVSGDALPLAASSVSWGGIIRRPPFGDAFFSLLFEVHWLGCSAPEIGFSGGLPLGR